MSFTVKCRVSFSKEQIASCSKIWILKKFDRKCVDSHKAFRTFLQPMMTSESSDVTRAQL